MSQNNDAKRIAEILFQWAAYKENKNSLTKSDLKILLAEAKKMKVVLK